MSTAQIGIMKVEKGKAFDKKIEATLVPLMKAATEKAIRSSEMKAALAEGSKTFTLDTTVNSLTQSPNGTSIRLDIKVTMTVSDNDRAFGFLKGSGNVPDADPKRPDNDVKALAESVLTKMIVKDVSKAIADRIAKQ